MDFVPTDNRVQIKESKQIKKYLNLSRELKNQWTIKMMVIPIIVGALGTVTKDLEKRWKEMEIKVRIKTILTTALLKLVRILRRELETQGDLLSLRL